MCDHFITWNLFEIFSWNFTQMYITITQIAKHKLRNSDLPAFGVTTL